MHTSRHSPAQHLLESQGIDYREYCGGWYPVRSGAADEDERRLAVLGLCDLSGLQKLGLKGPVSDTWLASKELDVPSDIFSSQSISDGGLIVRLGADEFLLEDGVTNATLPALSSQIESHKGRLVRVEHQEATFLLTGRRALEALAQVCGINFREAAPRNVIFTRVAAVSCGVYPETFRDGPAYRLWVDPSYAVYLWKTLAEICSSLDGGVIGAGCIYNELLS